MHGKAHQIEDKQGNLLEIIMKAYFSKALLAASIGALGLATASAVSAEPPAQDPAPQGWGRCEQNPATWRDQARARSEARFKQLDTDSDGTVSKAEAEKGPPHLAEQFDEVDANKDGKLSQDEMRNARRARMAQCKEDPEKCRAEMKQRFETAWKRADTDGDGTLSKARGRAGHAANGAALRPHRHRPGWPGHARRNGCRAGTSSSSAPGTKARCVTVVRTTDEELDG